MRLRELQDRIEVCNNRHRGIPKERRIEHDLRPGLFEISYSGDTVVEICRELLSRSFRDPYPFRSGEFDILATPDLQQEYASPVEGVNVVEFMVSELAQKLKAGKNASGSAD